MYSRLIEPPKQKSFFLLGPRGTGKSSWVKTRFPTAIYIDLLESEVFNDLLANPGRLEGMIPRGFSDWVIIDEIQKVPDLLDEVHRLIESSKCRFILTGSSARKLRKKGVNLLAGRALTLHCHPLTATELGPDFDLSHSLRWGQLPCAYTENDPKAYLESYVKTYLREEIQQESLTRRLAAFSRFLEAASFSQGGVLNVSQVASDCSVERKVVENYFSIVEDLLWGSRLPPFGKKAKRRIAAHPKFYFFDVGVYRTLRPAGPLDRPEEIEGAALETLFLQELRVLNDYLGSGYTISYWRTAYGHEVDFILYGEKGLIAFEIKRAGKVRPADLTGLRAFLDDYPIAKTYLVYGGERSWHEGKIEIIGIKDCIKKLPQLLSATIKP